MNNLNYESDHHLARRVVAVLHVRLAIDTMTPWVVLLTKHILTQKPYSKGIYLFTFVNCECMWGPLYISLSLKSQIPTRSSHSSLSSSSSPSFINVIAGSTIMNINIPWKIIRNLEISSRRNCSTTLLVKLMIIHRPSPRSHLRLNYRIHPGGRNDFIAGIADEIGIGSVEFLLEPLDLSLEEGNGSHAAVDRVPDTCLGLIGQGVDGVLPLVGEEVVEELGDIAGAENLVDVGELLGLLRWEVRSENAAGHAFAPQELASGTGWVVGGAGWWWSHFPLLSKQKHYYMIKWVLLRLIPQLRDREAIPVFLKK